MVNAHPIHHHWPHGAGRALAPGPQALLRPCKALARGSARLRLLGGAWRCICRTKVATRRSTSTSGRGPRTATAGARGLHMGPLLCCEASERSRHWLLLGPVRPRAASALIGAGHHEADIIHFFVGSAGGRRRRGAGARNERHLAVPVQVPASSLGTRRPGCPRCRTSEALTRPRSTRGFTETRHAVVVDGQAGHHRR